jgi:hypothetical protein
MGVIHQKQRRETPETWARRQTVIALGGVIALVLAQGPYASRSGDWFPAIVNLAVIIPLFAVIHFVLAVAGRRWSRLLLWVPLPLWLIPSLWIAAVGYRESQPERIFQTHVMAPIPESVTEIHARRTSGIGELHCRFNFTCDSNAIAALVAARQLQQATQFVYHPTILKVDAAELEEIANKLILSRTQRFGLPTNYLKEPMLFENDPTGGKPRMQLWVERDQGRAYFLVDY